MKVRALKGFVDLEENKRRGKGEEFEVTEERFEEINSSKYGKLVEAVVEVEEADNVEVTENNPDGEVVEGESEFPKHTGGGYYELSNGEKVKGKEEALQAEANLKE